jgi:SAM-dependent methyltransferase
MERETHVGSTYVLGYAAAEQDRLRRQASWLAPLTERFFRAAGIGTAQRVLEIGSGMGDVAHIAARLVGPTGKVVGVEQDRTSVARARARTDAAGLDHVAFVQADAHTLVFEETFDAVVGRFVLNHSRDVPALVRALTRWVRPGGVVAFQEVALSPALAVAASVPLWRAVLAVIEQTLHFSGLDPDLGLSLHRVFQQAGLPAPHLHLEIPFAPDDSVIRLEVDLVRTLRGVAGERGVSLAALGDLDTLVERIQAQALSTCAPIGFAGVVSVWSTVS